MFGFLRGRKDGSRYTLKKGRISHQHGEFHLTGENKQRLKGWIRRYPEVYGELALTDGINEMGLSYSDGGATMRLHDKRSGTATYALNADDLAAIYKWLRGREGG